MNQEKTPIEIRVLSDLICPNCYISIHHLEQAIKAAGDKFKITFYVSPIIISNKIPKEGLDLKDYLKQNGNGQENEFYKQMDEIIQMAKNLETPREMIPLSDNYKYYNTINAHRLMEYVMEEHNDELQTKLYILILRGFFEKGLNISEPQVLGQLCAEVGLDKQKIIDFLSKESESPNSEEIQELAGYNQYILQSMGGGIPSFLMNGEVALSGNKTQKEFEEAFKQVKENLQ